MRRLGHGGDCGVRSRGGLAGSWERQVSTGRDGRKSLGGTDKTSVEMGANECKWEGWQGRAWRQSRREE